MVDYHSPAYRQVPPRKQPAYNQLGSDFDPSRTTIHAHTRTVSSNVFPSGGFQAQGSPDLGGRRLSTATTSTTSTSGRSPVPTRSGSNMSSIRRSGSQSSSAPSSYVALLRKQKATVWCDRSQHEDPRIVAQQKAAKMRAAREVYSTGQVVVGKGRTGTMGSGSMVGKIRHHGGQKQGRYTTATLAGSGVPMRLSANEIGAEEAEDGDIKRPGSWRSSVGSGSNRFPSGYQRPQGRFSTGSNPPSGGDNSPEEIPEEDLGKPEYFGENGAGTIHPSNATSLPNRSKSNGGNSSSSTSTGEREDSFGNVGDLGSAPLSSVNPASEKKKSADELRRRGSVDDRSMTMSGVRLFVANPDLDD